MIGHCPNRVQGRCLWAGITGVLLLLTGCAALTPGARDPMPSADTLVLGGRVIVSAIPERRVDAFAIRDGRVLASGTQAEMERWAGADTQRIDVGGRVVIPGLIDSHAHLWGLARNRLRVDLVGTGSYSEVIEAVRIRSHAVEDGEWLEGRGWDQNDWEDSRFPTHHALSEAFPNHPVALRRVDGHALLVNARALDEAGIDASTAEPAGGRILRDAAGRPTGVLTDHAMHLVLSILPEPSPERMREELVEAMAHAVSLGLTGVHDMGLSPRAVETYEALGRAGDLPLRVVGFWEGESPASVRWMRRPPVRFAHEGRWSLVGVKLYQDGALGSRGAALLEDYSDDPGNRGQVFHDAEELVERVRRVTEAGYQVAVHAIGDRANRMVLDAYEMASTEREDGKLWRPRIEHAQVIAASDIGRFAELGILALMQPTHATSDMPWAAARLGGLRVQGAYAWQTLLQTGAVVALGSDFPVENVNPLWGLHAAMTRTDAENHPAGGWGPEERLSPSQALEGFTRSAAFAVGMEADLGTLERGKWADFVVLDVDPLRDSPAKLRESRVWMTVVGGIIQHASPEVATAPDSSGPRAADPETSIPSPRGVYGRLW